MPLIHRSVTPVKLSSAKLELKGKYECEFVAVSNRTLVNVLRQLAALVNHAADIFSETATLTEQVGTRIRTVKLRLDELEAKTELFDPKLVPVPEGSLDDVSISSRFSRKVVLETKLFQKTSRPRFLGELFDKAGSHRPTFPPHSPVATLTRKSVERLISNGDNKRPASFAALRDWKLDDYLDEKIATLNKKKQSGDEVKKALASPFPSQLVQVDVTGQGFDRMKKNRRSLVVHTKRIKRSKRRNTICGSMPNKECGIQTSFSSVNCSPNETDETQKKYGIDSGHWSSCTSSAQGGNGVHSTTSAPSPWDPTSLSTSSDFLFDDEDRCLTPQLEHFTDGLVSDSDSVDTDGYFTSFRSDCGFPKSKKSPPEGSDLKEEVEEKDAVVTANSTTESEYDLFGKGSTSTTASSCGTVVLRSKPNPPARTTSTSGDHIIDNNKSQSQDDMEWEERVKRKSLIERVPSLVVVTPSPSCSSESPPPLKDPGLSTDTDSDRDSGRITPKAEDLLHGTGSECGTLSDTDSELRGELRPASTSSSNSNTTVSSGNSTLTLTSCPTASTTLPRPDVIPDVQIIRTKASSNKLDVSREYFSLDSVTVLLNSSSEEECRQLQNASAAVEVKTNKNVNVPTMERIQSPTSNTPGSATSGKIRGARVVLDANGEIIFASETLRRKRKPKVSFDPGNAVKTMDYDNFASTYGRIRESVYDRIRKDAGNTANENEKLYECIEEIRKQNLRHPYLHLQEEKSIAELHPNRDKSQLILMGENGDNNNRCSSSSSNGTTSSKDSLASTTRNRYASRPPLSPPTEDGAKVNMLLETDLDSAIPPSMPDLKNLPKIKDRLKRNESYRIANTEENAGAPPGKGGRQSPTTGSTRPALLSLNPLTNKNSLNRRMSFASNKDNLPNGNLHLNKKRDILEEDPVFIQQILNLSTTSAKSPCSPSAYNSRITLSKLALSPEDRPTFLRRETHDAHSDDPVWIAESPPTMDEIAKEIYRFRKKFNIQPNATSRNLLPSSPPSGTLGLDFNGNSSGGSNFRRSQSVMSRPLQRSAIIPQQHYLDRNGNPSPSSYSSASTIPLGFPKLQVQLSSPLSYSTPIKGKPSANSSSSSLQMTPNSNTNNTSYSTLFPRPMSSLSNCSNNNSIYYDSLRRSSRGPADISSRNSSVVNGYIPIHPHPQQPPPPPVRNFANSGRKIFPSGTGAFNTSDYYVNSNANSYAYGWGSSSTNSGRVAHYRRNSMSLAEPSPGSISLGTRTSLTDFKKLLQSAKPKKNAISAMEALKPKVQAAVETTI